MLEPWKEFCKVTRMVSLQCKTILFFSLLEFFFSFFIIIIIFFDDLVTAFIFHLQNLSAF